MADIIIKGGRVLANGAAEEGVVVVDKGLITFVGRETDEKADTIINAKGCIVMPGLINAHTHLAMTLFKGYAENLAYEKWTKKIQSAEMKLTPEDVRAGAYLGILEMIKTGTTAFADMYIHMDEVAKVVKETGMRASLGYGMIEGLNEDSEIKLKNREKFTKKWNGAAQGRITTMYAPHSALSCSKEFLIKVREMATRDKVGIHTHVLETENELKLMKNRYGMCSVKFLDSINFLSRDVLAAHCIWLSDDDIEILKNRKVNAVHCPTSNMALNVGTAPVAKMLAKGVNVALGTDGAASSGSLDMWKEMMCASHHHKYVQALTLLEMATVNGAKALGIKAGVLRAGYHADIIIVELEKPSSNLFSTIISSGNVKTTIVDGKILMENRIVNLDEEKIIKNAKNAILKITENN